MSEKIFCHHCNIELTVGMNVNVSEKEMKKGLQIYRCDPCAYLSHFVGKSVPFGELSTQAIISFGKGWRAALEWHVALSQKDISIKIMSEDKNILNDLSD